MTIAESISTAPRELFDLPGPRGLPWIGSALQIAPARLHQQLEAWAHEFGDAYRLRLGRNDMLVIARHEQIANVLRDRPDGFKRTDRLELIGAEMGLKPGVFTANGDTWKRQRRMVMAAFDPAHVKAYFASLAKVTLRLRSRWLKAAAANADIDLQSDLMRFTVDTITGLAFGADVNTLESDDDVIQRYLDQIFPALFTRIMSPAPTWRWFKRRSDRALDDAIIQVNRAIDRFIADARARLDAEPARRAAPTNLLEAMLAAVERDGGGISDDEVAGNVLVMLLAGEDTTANTIAWMIDLLMRNPAALQAATEEVRRVAPDPERFSFEQMAALDYLEACTHETMRIKPVAPFLPLQAIKDTVVGDVRVPAGTIVASLMRFQALDDRYVARAAAFEPQRWLAGERGARRASTASPKTVSMPFGAGPRICPGRYLAMLEIKMAMALLLSSFDIERLDTPDGQPPVEQMSFTMQPVGLRMRLRRVNS